MTADRFEQFWHGAATPIGGLPGFGQDSYINYFWQQCPDIEKLLPQIESVYTGLYRSVVKEQAAKAGSTKAAANTVKTTKGASR